MVLRRTVLAIAGILILTACSATGPRTITPERSFITERILFGALEAGEPLICSIELVRGRNSVLFFPDRTVYDYRAWLERQGTWVPFYQDRWNRSRSGGEVVSTKSLGVVRSFDDMWSVNFEEEDLELYLRCEAFFTDYTYESDHGEVTLSIAQAEAVVNGTSTNGRAFYEERRCLGAEGCDPKATEGGGAPAGAGLVVIWDQGGEGVWRFTEDSASEGTLWRGFRKDEFGRVTECSDLTVTPREEASGEKDTGSRLDFASGQLGLDGSLDARPMGQPGESRVLLTGVMNLGSKALRVYGIAENL